jgi:DNA-binding phage protein
MIEKNNALNFINKVHAYLDNALSENESSQFIKTIHSDPALLAILNRERNMRTFMKNNLERKTVQNKLIESIKGQLY